VSPSKPIVAARRSAASGSVVAIDLGASSGRVIVGRVRAGTLELQEVHRFPNEPVMLPDGLHWDILRLYHEVLTGLRLAGRAADDILSVGIDSWAIDYGLLDGAGSLIGDPYHYRDRRTERSVPLVHAAVSRERIYATTGIQFLSINTLYQLVAASSTPAFRGAATMLLIPDLIGYWLSGQVVAEITNASTTSLLDARDGTWSTELVKAVGIPLSLLPELRGAGDVIGPLRPGLAAEIGLPAGVVLTLVGSHDTASAVVGVPADGRAFAYIACGTWALVGVELDAPVLTDESRDANFTNERGIDGTVRYLRNVTGLWLLQESIRTWERDGSSVDLAALLADAADLPAGGPVVDPDTAEFGPPGDMPARIAAEASRTGQPAPEGRAGLVRCILDSLAAAFARAVRDAVRLSGRSVAVVHLVGGGSRNALLCQLTADACELPVLAGPVEATAIGNVLVQARAHGLIDGDLAELRALVRATHELHRYEPRPQEGPR
jgi:rhamnulokinase